ncbi:hypothetical protein BDR26DRAFT_549702 [Obelidium mucronatum]|nr:hypothetical protein BDR26DRAFT_549702 [Obelidium mucronatum]
MFILFQSVTPAAYALFKLKGESEDIKKICETPNSAKKNLRLKAFQRIDSAFDPTGALITPVKKLSKGLRKFLNANLDANHTLAVEDDNIAALIVETFEIKVVSNNTILKLMQIMHNQSDTLLSDSRLRRLEERVNAKKSKTV